jgi:periplasmic protein TonB
MSVSMSHAVAPLPPPERPAQDPTDELFSTALVVSDPGRARRTGISWPVSIAGHLFGLALVLLVPILWPEKSPVHPDYIRALIYNPPPPPPPPLNKGSAMLEKTEPVKPVTPETKPDETKLTAELEIPKEDPLKPEARDPETDQAGSPTGSDMGDPAGMEEGVEGGVVGGVPGGVIGGVIGGTGDGPVMDYDQAPRPIKITQPKYPPDAFVKKIEGTVEVEILIDSSGRVAKARVVRSIPLLDSAALQTVYQWVFSPAIKNGRPVATIASAPVTFRIF